MLERISSDYSSYVNMLDSNGNVTGRAYTVKTPLSSEKETQSFEDVKNNFYVYEVMSDGSETAEKIKFTEKKFSPQVQMGMNYKKQFFDFSNAADYNMLTESQNLDGMTNFQKYKVIYEKYQHCYGEDFLKAEAVDYPITTFSEDDPYMSVIRRFYKETAEVCGGEMAAKEARRDAYYGGLTDSEVRQAVIDRFNTEDGITFMELYHMSYEMLSVGLDGGFHFRLDNLFADFAARDTAYDANIKREGMLDKKVTTAYFDKMQRVYESCVSHGIMIMPDYMETLSAIRANV
ncbi:MAG: hypothetical protein IJ007_10030 [Oscillospiraceae bacterium]|nr:hypothetical protein [Oscillospiraceae bacterium]